MNSLFPKILGKVVTYFGLMIGIASIVEPNTKGVICGVILVILGSIIHELNEQ